MRPPLASLLGLLLTAAPAAAQAPDLVVDGPVPGMQLGFAVAGAGDVDGDGLADLVVGANLDPTGGGPSFAGSLRVLRGTDGAELLVVNGSFPVHQLGADVAGVGDVDGDGTADVAGAYSGPLEGRARVFSGADGSVLVDVVGGPVDQLWFSLDGPGDVTGDGVPDLLVGVPGHDAGALGNAGRAALVSGADGSLALLVDGTQAGAALGRAVAAAGDVDLDGTPDLIVAAPLFDGAGVDAGRVRVVSGATGLDLFVHEGAAAGDRFGDAVAGGEDVDGDGRPDVVVGARGADASALEAGALTVFSGATGATLLAFTGVGSGELLGAAVSGGGDRNGDGLADPVAGAHGALGAAGLTRTVSGLQGFSLLHTAGATGAFHGAAVAGVGDTDGDGLADLLVGAHGHDDVRGRVELYRGVAGDLIGSPQTVSIAGGGTQDLYLDPGPSWAGASFWVLGTHSGTSPGFDVLGLHVPLNFDPYLSYSLACGACPPFVGNLLTIGADGTARMRISIPAGALGPSGAGLVLNHAYALFSGGQVAYMSADAPPLALPP